MTVYPQSLSGALGFVGGQNLFPDNTLYPSDDLYPYGGALVKTVNHGLPGVFRPAGVVLASPASARIFTAVLQPHAVFLRVTTRMLFSASLMTAAFSAQRVSHTLAKALFGALTAAGSMHTALNPDRPIYGGGGWGTPMPDSHFTRYKPTLRRQRMRV